MVGSLLPADIYARYLRQRGEQVLCICGTDDHGAPAEIAALNAAKPVAEYCQEMYQVQKDIYKKFNLSFDYFGKTSTAANKELTQQIFKDLDRNGFIIEKTIEQFYSHADKRFLADRYIIGKCPKCSYEMARGDQCDGCGSLLDPTMLINPRSSLNPQDELKLRTTKHLFLDLPKLQGRVQQWSETLVDPSRLVTGIIRKWLEEGLEQRCITRDLDWGIPVPKPGYEGKVFYVWFDAPNGYISISKDWAAQTDNPEQWRDWWFNAQDVCYTQFMAKDNVPFHAVMWPAILLGTEQPWKMVDYIKGFNWLNYEGGKFSTSQNRGVFTDQALELFPADIWRYYLMASVPESNDSDFSFAAFAAIVNSDLANSLGNFISRIMALLAKYFDNKVPAYVIDKVDADLMQRTQALCQSIDIAQDELKYRDVITNIRALWAFGNEYLTQQQPWIMIKQDPQQAAQVLVNCLHLIRIFAITAWPIIPESAEKIMHLLNSNESIATIPLQQAVKFAVFEPGHEIGTKVNLFPKIEEDQIKELTRRFQGGQ
jgi:methionyl-tRNA synthetase